MSLPVVYLSPADFPSQGPGATVPGRGPGATVPGRGEDTGEDLAFSWRSLGEGDVVELRGEEAHHIAVKRLRHGESVQVVDGLGWRAPARLVEVQKGREPWATLELQGSPQTEAASSTGPTLTLIQGLAKDKRDEQALEMACEIGAGCVVPWPAWRSVGTWDSPQKIQRGLQRWFQIALSAMKQSRQSRLAQIDSRLVSHSSDLAGMVGEILGRGGTVFVLHEDASYQGVSALSAQLSSLEQCPEIAVVVGPEGGITPAELEALRQAGARLALLGPSVLRTSSAGPAALAIIQALVGTWR